MGKEIHVRIGQKHYETEITAGNHTLLSDKAPDIGTDKGAEPGDLLLASLGSCKAMTMRMYADNKGWELNEAIIRLSMDVIKSEQQQTTFIRCHIELHGNLDEKQRARLLDIANKCPLHKIITGTVEVDSNLLP